jgi:hypothetical protein
MGRSLHVGYTPRRTIGARGGGKNHPKVTRLLALLGYAGSRGLEGPTAADWLTVRQRLDTDSTNLVRKSLRSHQVQTMASIDVRWSDSGGSQSCRPAAKCARRVVGGLRQNVLSLSLTDFSDTLTRRRQGTNRRMRPARLAADGVGCGGWPAGNPRSSFRLCKRSARPSSAAG